MERRLISRQIVAPPMPIWAVVAGDTGPIFHEIGFFDMAFYEYPHLKGHNPDFPNERFQHWRTMGYVAKDIAFSAERRDKHGVVLPRPFFLKKEWLGKGLLGFAHSCEPDQWQELWMEWKATTEKEAKKREKTREYARAYAARKKAKEASDVATIGL